MDNKRILIVEDESIVVLDLEKRLKKMGYLVVAMVTMGEDAFKVASETKPDLVLMDIKLAGKVDGIQTAQYLRDFFALPVIYLTAYADEATLARAKVTQPFGYLIKPFRDQELQSNIEMALYDHKMMRRLEESEKWLTETLNSIRDAVIATNDHIFIRFMNPVAENLTGWEENMAIGLPISPSVTS